MRSTIFTPPAKAEVEPNVFVCHQKSSYVPFSEIGWNRRVIVEKYDSTRFAREHVPRPMVTTGSSTAGLSGLREFEFRDIWP